jgi:uncharacterized phage protein (TIGR02218 family)
MRNFSQELLAKLADGAHFVFLFDVKLSCSKKLYLTNANQIVESRGYHYLPNSALQILRATFNDGAQDNVAISGLFEEGGISQNEDLHVDCIDIWLFLPKSNIHQHVLQMFCSQVIYLQMEFTMVLQNASAMLNKSITSVYSHSCRATFGDLRCAVKLDDFTCVVNVLSAQGNKLTICLKNLKTNYNFGRVYFLERPNTMLILRQVDNCLILQKTIPQDLLQSKQVKLIPSCDKSLITCGKQFANSVNFRGEPYI